MLDHCLVEDVRAAVLGCIRRLRIPRELRMRMLRPLTKPGRLLAADGASLPVALTLLSFATAAQREPTRAEGAAAAMELLMAAGDLMDDIQDAEDDDACNRRTTGQVLEAVCLLLLLCHHSIAGLTDAGIPAARVLRALRTLDELAIAAIRGQDLDMSLETATTARMDRAWKATQLKAASLTRCAAEIGAVLATDEGDAEIVNLLARFGWHFGLVAQLMNDITAVWPGDNGKSDLKLKKKTLPIVFSLSDEALCRECRELVCRYYCSKDERSMSEETVKKAIWHSGGIHYTWRIAALEKLRATQISQEVQGLRPGTWSLAPLIS